METEIKRRFYYGIGILLLLLIVIVIFYIKHNYSSKNHTVEQTINTDNVLEEYNSEENNKNLIKEKYTVAMGNKVDYVFSEETLTVEGSGAIWDFNNLEDLQDYLVEELYSQYVKKDPTAQVTQNDFFSIIDNVKKIEIEEGITEIGKGAFSTFFYTESIFLPTTVEQIKEVAFLGMGQYAKETKWKGLELLNIDYAETSFMGCNGIAVTETGEYIINETEEIPKEAYAFTELELMETIKMGEDVEYQLYNNGLLIVIGSGGTYNFKDSTELYEYMKENLCCMTRNEVYERWFHQIKEVLVFSGVAEIGDYALSNLWYVEEISIVPKLTRVGEKAFDGLGSYAEQDTVWNVDLLEK